MCINKILSNLLLGAAMFFVIGCKAQQGTQDSILVNTYDEYFHTKIVQDLNSNEIAYEIVGETAIKISEGDAQYVMYKLNEFTTELLPAHRSIAPTQPKRRRLIELLNEHDIEFKQVDLYNQKWIVWKDEDSDTVSALLGQIDKEIYGEEY